MLRKKMLRKKSSLKKIHVYAYKSALSHILLPSYLLIPCVTTYYSSQVALAQNEGLNANSEGNLAIPDPDAEMPINSDKNVTNDVNPINPNKPRTKPENKNNVKNNKEIVGADKKIPTKGNSVFLADQPDTDPATNSEINVKNAELAAIVRIFSKRTKRNYLLDERVKGKVTMYLPGKLNPDESIKILDSILSLKGFTSVPIGDNFWKIIPSREAKQSTVPTVNSEFNGPGAAAVVTRLIPLKHASPEEVEPLISQLVSPDGLVNSNVSSNSIVVIDYENNIERITKIIDSIDVPFSDRDMTIIPIKNADAKDIAEKLKDLLGDPSKKGDANPDSDLLKSRGAVREASFNANGQSFQPQQAIGGIARNPVQNNKNLRTKEPKIIDDQRTNSIIVVADDETTARIRALVAELDSKVDLSGNRFYVYRCQHAKAEELAQVLSGLAGEGSTTNTTNTTNNDNKQYNNRSSGSNSLRGRQGLNGGGSGLGDRSNSSGFGSNNSNGQNSRQPASVKIGENISITADPATNSLIINAGKTDYEKIRLLIDQLDIKRRQVLVEAMLLEVSVENGETIGTEFITSTGGADGGVVAINKPGSSQGLNTLLSDPTKLSDFSVAAASAGTLRLPGGISIPSQSVLLSAAQSNSNVNVLSAPTLLTTDNEQAEIVVGQNIPFLASTSTNETNLNNTFNQIDRQDVGITLRITPQISSNDFVTLSIFTDVSDIVPTANSSLGPTTTVRSSETTVITKDGQMIVIGGLMSDQNKDSNAGVPFLKDIPVLGYIFKQTKEERRRTNLLTFITPRIVKDQYDARDSTVTRAKEMKKTIRDEEITPERREILDNQSIDNVAEISDFTGEAPTTILPPKSKMKQPIGTDTYALKNSSSDSQAIEASFVDTEGDEYTKKHISLKAKNSKAYEKEQPRNISSSKISEPKKVINLNSSKDATTKQNTSIKNSNNRYFVFEIVKSPNFALRLPFTPDQNKRFALSLPPEISPDFASFFEKGRIYSYQIDNVTVEAKVVEASDSIGNLKNSISDSSWYSMSPYEIMNLGKGPWLKK